MYSFGIVLNELETQTLPWITELPQHHDVEEANSAHWVVQEVKRRTLAHERPTLCNSRLLGAVITACWAADPVCLVLRTTV